jgi:Mg2+ and Co2+ transporter CorA
MEQTQEQKLDNAISLLELTIQQQSGHKSDVLYRIGALEDSLNSFKREIKPMTDAFKESENYKMVWTKTGISFYRKGRWIIVIGGAITVVVLWLKWFIKQLI